MKITDMTFRTVSVPFLASLVENWPDDSYNFSFTPDYPMTMIWVHTDEGLTGVGESMALDHGRIEQMKQTYVGRRLWDVDLAAESPSMQCALYDIAGQALDLPMHQLMGTKHRDRVELAYWSPPMTPKATLREAERAKELGFRVHKLKARPWTIVEIAQLAAKACGPDFQLRVDPNTQFGDVATAARLARELLPYNIEVYEDPIRFHDVSWYRQLRAKCEPPVARHFGAPADVFQFLKNDAIDALNTGGNETTIRKNAALAEAAGMPIWTQIFAFGSCVGTTYAAHLTCTIPNCTMPIDELPHVKIDDLSEDGFELRDGAVTVPDRPGLGITINMKAVEKYQTA
jgi:L-alanine-DL-glutamate epimerase-like enolase superfamily enzyme